MAMILTAKIAEKGFEQDYVAKNEYFYLINGKEIRAPSVVDWCNDCQKLCDAELLPNIVAINGRIERFKSGALDEFLNLNDEKREAEILEMELLCSLRKNRKSGAKCLVCGSSNIIEIDVPEGYPPKYPPTETKVRYQNSDHTLFVYISGHVNLKSVKKVVLNEEGEMV